MTEVVETDTLVIGAGPAGLAIGACLRRAGVPLVILERGDGVGEAWRRHYERLHLHTARDYSGLPYRPFPADYPQYVPRLKVVEYLEAYAREFDLRPVLGEDADRVARTDGRWETATRAGGRYISRRVVLATGYNRAPVTPSWPGQEGFRGTVLHSSGYRSGEAFRGKRVLVVGIGNTGGEIAIDLHERGAAEVAISVRSPVVVIPRDFLGRPTQVTAIRLGFLPVRVRDWIGRFVSWMTFGDLSRVGFGRPRHGPATLVARGRIPLIDVGTIDLIRRGAISVAPDIERFEADGIVFRDGSRRALDAVVLATGYRPKLDDFLECAPRVTDERGYPRSIEAGEAAPGLYFLGFVNPPTGFLREIALDAPRIAERIVRERSREAEPAIRAAW